MENKDTFSEDLRTGTWKYFYSNGIPKQEVEFNGNGFNVIFFNDSTGVSGKVAIKKQSAPSKLQENWNHGILEFRRASLCGNEW